DYEGRGPVRAADEQLLGLSALYRLYECADGRWIFLAAPQDAEWTALVAVLTEHADAAAPLAADERFATADLRREQDAELASELAAIFCSRPAAEWERL